MPNMPYGQVIKRALHEDCAFCRNFNTEWAIVINSRLIPICGRCAESLVRELDGPRKTDDRR